MNWKVEKPKERTGCWYRIFDPEHGHTIAYVPERVQASLLAQMPEMREWLMDLLAWIEVAKKSGASTLPDENCLRIIREALDVSTNDTA